MSTSSAVASPDGAPPALPPALASAFLGLREQPAGPESVACLARVVAAIRPARPEDIAHADTQFACLVDHIDRHETDRTALREHLQTVLQQRSLVSFFTESGILPATGFFTELWRLFVHRLLPDVPDEHEFRDAMRELFNQRGDWIWLDALEPGRVLRFWALLAPSTGITRNALEQMLEAVLMLAYRISGLGIEQEMARLEPRFRIFAARFMGVASEAQRFVETYRASLDDPGRQPEDERHLLVILDQCREALDRAHRTASQVGTSTRLTFLMTRARQSIERLEQILRILGSRFREDAREAALRGWAAVAHRAVRAENRRHSLRAHMAQGLGLLALRVTDNAAQTGEHYIATTRPEYLMMWRSAMGAGVIIACLALLKIGMSKLGGPLAVMALLYSLNYGLGFVLIYMLHLTIATKQPAMTAQTLAGAIGAAQRGRIEELEHLVDLAAAVCRSQIAAILGNISIAFPTAVLIGVMASSALGHPFIDMGKAAHLLDDLNPLGWALPHAAIAGVFLFFSGVLTGYFDNRARVDRIGLRVSRLGWLRAVFGTHRAIRIGQYMEGHLGGIMGNLLFGCMLGSAGVIGIILGLPIDIRHIAFSSANLGYAWVAFDFAMPWQTFAWGALGVALIGAVNLAVSFALALWMALRARGVEFSQWGALAALMFRTLLRSPARFLLPPRTEAFETAVAAQDGRKSGH